MTGDAMARPKAPSTSSKGPSKTGRSAASSSEKVSSAPAPKPAAETDNVPTDASAAMTSVPNTIRVGNRTFSGASTTLGPHKLDILPDMPDLRDRIYLPNLRALHPGIYPRIAFQVRNQGRDASCTGFALAHVIDFLLSREVGPDRPDPVSSRMLYEMAKRNDEWEGTAYEGSSLRGAIKGFYRNGVCSDESAPDHPGNEDWALTYTMAKEARDTRLGAYFRLQPDISDYHAALNDVGVIYASAQIHSRWEKPKDDVIQPGGDAVGGHAFAIVGYDDTGFWVLNSWGPAWGVNGVAKWTYADWANTIMDAWVLQLGVRAPAAFGAAPGVTPSSATGLFGFNEPARGDIVGHYVNIDDGLLVTSGKYGSPTETEMLETVERLVDPEANDNQGYEHLVIYSHGGLNSLAAEAQRIATWKRNSIFSRNRIYNFHLMWGSGFLDEAFGKLSESPAVGRAGGWISDWFFEAGVGKQTGSYAWRNMKQDAQMAFSPGPEYDGGFKGLSPLLSGLDKAPRRPKLHLIGHSAGAIVLGHLLSNLAQVRFAEHRSGIDPPHGACLHGRVLQATLPAVSHRQGGVEAAGQDLFVQPDGSVGAGRHRFCQLSIGAVL